LNMARVSECDYAEHGCDAPRCKKGFCVIEHEDQARKSALEASETDAVRKEAVAVIGDLFRLKRRGRPTDGQITKLLANPKVIAAAKQRLADERALDKMKF